MSDLIIQVFLSVLVFGGFIIMVFFIFRNFFSPRKITTLKNYIKTENYKAAVNLAKDILNRDKNNVEAHFYLGEAYYFQEKHELSLIEFKTAEKSGVYSSIDERKLRERMAEISVKMGDLDEALKEYILLTQNYPNDYLYFFKAGELFEMKDQKQQAMKYYADSIKINDNYVSALVNMGQMLLDFKNYTEAHHYLQRAVNKDPNNFKAFFYMGLVAKTENNYKNALKYFEKSLRDKEYKVRSLMERGVILMLLNRFEEAVIELDRALKNTENEDNVKLNIRYVLANCYEQMRNITEAIALWEEIYALRPDFRDVSEKLSNYQELRIDDRMKDFLTATEEEFQDICKSIVHGMGLNVTDEIITTKDTVEYYTLEADSKWRNMKKRPKLIHISRRNVPIDENVLRKAHEKMREKGVIRGVILTSSSFSKLAITFAKERPLELIDKDGLQELLNKVDS